LPRLKIIRLMKIAFNGTALLSPLTGIGQYAHHLALGLQQVPDMDLLLFYGNRFERQVGAGAPPLVGKMRGLVRRLIPNSYEISRWLQQRLFDRGARANRFDLYHEPNFLAYRFDGPSVVTVHDLSWIRYPHTHPVERVKAMEKYFEPGLRRASVVLTDSEFVKRELIEVFHVDPSHILPVALGLDPIFRPMNAQETRPVLAEQGLHHGDYFLSVGTMEPRKNIEATVAAYGRLPQSIRERHPLVIVGLRGWRTTSMEKLLAPLVASGQVRTLGYLARSDLATVTAGALAMVYPSLYEGFGLPPLEAMGCAVPAITSNVSSLPEVVGDTGLMVAPHDIEALTEAMRSLACEPQQRAMLASAAQARAAQFTWGRCVAETAAAYRRAANTTR
jgi:glycosyltransferase involved in cell wall biosynthesis